MIGSNYLYSQTESQYYAATYTVSSLQNMLDFEKNNILNIVTNSQGQTIKSIQISVVSNKSPMLIESSVENQLRKVTISNTFLVTLAKITDAFYIEANIDKSKKTNDYLKYCIENTDNQPSGPLTYYKLSNDNSKKYSNTENYNSRLGLFILSIRFILLHEFAHHLYGDIDNYNSETISKIDKEIRADGFAMDCFSNSGWPPILLAQIMHYFYLFDNYQNDNGQVITHPTGLERVSSLMNTSLNDLKKTYQMMSKLATIPMTYGQMRDILYDSGIQLYSELIEEMDRDYSYYEDKANNGNSAAQIKMGLMYFTGTNGWQKNNDAGFNWLIKSSKRSDFGALFLGMFYEYNGNLEAAISAYQKSVEMGNYYAKVLVYDLINWRAKPEEYTKLMKNHLMMKYNRCMTSCQTNFKLSKNDCELFYCNYTFLNMYTNLMEFRADYPLGN